VGAAFSEPIAAMGINPPSFGGANAKMPKGAGRT
jgi:hypothetical protein